MRAFTQVDVFGAAAYRGNPLAVVVDAEGVSDEAMQAFARWTHLSETTFLLPPTRPEADYRVRIFTTDGELPFAGHPTLGSAHAWLEAHPEARSREQLVQECGAGLIDVRRAPGGFGFAAPPLIRSGPVDEAELAEIVDALGLDHDQVVDAAWADNGPGWVGLLLRDARTVLDVRPTARLRHRTGLIGPYPDGSPAAFEVRALLAEGGMVVEDPVTGSLNASLAMWLLDTGRASAPYVATQGRRVGADGRVEVSRADGRTWITGSTRTAITGTVDL